MIERKFIEKGIRKSEMEIYLNSTLDRADYSHSDIKRTPMNTRIVIYAGRPGVVIGHAGSKINEMTRELTRRFNIDKPQIEVKSVPNSELDAVVIAKQITSGLERGMKHRQIINVMLKKIMSAGAIGVEITASGKISGSRSRNEKFMAGYLKKCGNTADVHTQTGFEKAVLKAGVIGIKVKLMTTLPSVLSIEKRIDDITKEKESEKKTSEQGHEDDKKTDVEKTDELEPKTTNPEPKETDKKTTEDETQTTTEKTATKNKKTDEKIENPDKVIDSKKK